jgi:hypothetical protein
MKIKSVLLFVLPALIATAAYAQTAGSKAGTSTPDAAPIVGVWRAQMDGLPAVTLTITNETGRLSGAILFYLLRRDEGKPVTSTAGIPEPLFNPVFDGTTLTFQVSHRRAHPPRTLSDPPVSFRLTLTGANLAGLINITENGLSENGSSSGTKNANAGLPMVRTDY